MKDAEDEARRGHDPVLFVHVSASGLCSPALFYFSFLVTSVCFQESSVFFFFSPAIYLTPSARTHTSFTWRVLQMAIIIIIVKLAS